MVSRASDAARAILLLTAAGALIIGLYARFKGLGSAPLSVDEYYLVRSIENVARSGLPAFPCGGYYTRGLTLQYLAAGLGFTGLSAQLAPRLIAALCSLLMLPAAYLLGRRSHSPLVGLLTVVVLALSVWEIEMARFGRMYAPFQPVCAWYLVFFLRYCIDRDARAWWPMLALSLLAPLVWEGGALLALLNLLPLFLPRPAPARWVKADWTRFVVAAIVFGIAYWFVTADFRGYNAASWPSGFSRALTFESHVPLASFASAFRHLPQGTGWYVFAALPLSAVVWALVWLWGWRQRPIAAAGLFAMLIAALSHQFGLVICVMVLLLLMRQASWQELFASSARPLHLALAACAIYWLLFGIISVNWQDGGLNSITRKMAAFCYQYLSFPDFAGVVAQPWARVVPKLGLGLFLLVGAATLSQARSDRPLNAERALEIAFLVLLLAASASHPPRQETRYVYFLYPLAIVIALTAIARGSQFALKNRMAAASATVFLGLGGFALSEDFQPHHLRYIDTPQEILRSQMNPNMQAHLEIRNDFPAMARWLQQQVSSGDLVINGVHSFDYYYPQVNYFFADQRDSDFPSWSCRQGTLERWGGYPLIYTVDALKATVASSHDTYLIFYPLNNPGLIQSLAAFSPQIAWSQGYVSIAVLHGPR
jgi:hypothetical protein